ncbi:MAG: ATP-binding domain-containing protein [Polyangiaceae bacterium]|nr:ATP-binding domain-containing protein [Polyangiaceae bacterium]
MQKTKEKRAPLPLKPPARSATADDERDEVTSERVSSVETKASRPAPATGETVGDQSKIVGEEESLLRRVNDFLATYRPSKPPPIQDYEADLISLRDQIAVARLEDVPALVQQMERVAGIAARRAENVIEAVDPKSPYFGHVRLKDEDKPVRDVLIGKTTLIDAKAGVRIVDWRHAPVSQIYYKYEEGSEYEETLGERDVVGTVLARRTVTIQNGDLRRVTAPQGVYVKGSAGWRSLSTASTELAGGQGKAVRPQDMRGVLGIDDAGSQREDRHLPEIAALLDPRQFELISKPDTGLVVIQGGAGSGKTTIGVHRLAYLAYQNKQRFTPDKMLVVVGSPALRAYIGEMLPSLGIYGLPIETYSEWAHEQRKKHFPWLDVEYEESTPSVVTRLKTHRVMLKLLEERAEAFIADPRTRKDSHGILWFWADLLTNLDLILDAFKKDPDPEFSEVDIRRAWRWCSDRCPAVVDLDPGDRSERKAAQEDSGQEADDIDDDRKRGVDNRGIEDDERARLDVEDDALLLRAYQKIKMELKKSVKAPLQYEHLFVDEAQDLSPIDLAVLLDCVRPMVEKPAKGDKDAHAQDIVHRSATLAGDTAQRIYLDAGFKDWRVVLDDLGLSRVDIEPLRIAYRSTKQVLEIARHVLGPLADPTPPVANRNGAPVELHEFPSPGAAVAFLADALRPLFAREPNATVAILARLPEQADNYYSALKMADIPNLRRIRAFEFAFRPGVEVTDVKQVKGLEYDYVVLVDVNASTYGKDDESRHLLHIGATRAAHQLWLVTTADPSPLLPESLRA